VPRLIVIRGPDENKQFELSAAVATIGRDRSNQIWLHDTEVSRKHAEFRLTEGAFHLIDIGSANGTFVNNQRVKEVVLQPGDHINIGQSTLVFSAAGRGEAQPPSDLAERISMITRHDLEMSSAIVKTISEGEGSRLLSRPEQATSDWLKTALANLGVMYETTQAVSHIVDTDQLLERIMELIFRSIEADRGCIVLRDPDTGRYQPKAARWRAGVDAEEQFAVSTTITDYVLREKKGVLVADAAHDERFSTGQSIVRLGIREVICVPMKGRHESLGVLYLDTRSSARDLLTRAAGGGKFNGDHLELAIAIAHQAALSIEVTRYHQAMLQAERLAAIGQAIAALSHHIKNILQGLRSGSDIVRMGFAEKNDTLLQKGWVLVQKNQGKIHDLVMDMLSYSKEREPAVEETDVNGVVREVCDLLKGRAAELGAHLEVRLDEHLPTIPVDPEGLHRALLNIVGNALDAVEEREKPHVVVATGVEDDEKWIRLVVLDNGVGIAPELLADVFKPFVSTKGSRGTGLGLAVSRKILREHGGDILVKSQVGKGSKFILRLPFRSPLSPDLSSVSGEVPLPPEKPPETD
jgi:signal transduction histidine kinase/pSer/pThr/pTyr-binding forkhead associated (FHA) protein